MVRLFVCLACAGLAGVAAAADWPQFRGSNRDNHSPDKGLLSKWPEGGPKVVWKGTGVGEGYSSVSLSGDRVYTMGNKGSDAYIHALDRKTGKLLWSTKIGSGNHRNYPGTRCTPTVDGDLVYGISAGGTLACVEAEGGKVKWSKSFSSDYGGKSGGWMYAESPLIDGDRLVCTPGGSKATLLVLDKATGKEILKAPIGDTAGYSSVIVSNAAGVKQYVTLTAGGTIGIDASSGKLLWRFDKLARTTANIPTPIAIGDQIFTAAGYNKGAALLTLTKNGNGVSMKQEYYNEDMKNKHGGLVIVGDYVYGDTDANGNLYCAKWKTGEVVWTKAEKKGGKGKGRGGRGSASLTYADGHLHVRYSDGYVALVPTDPKGYREVASFKIENSTTNSWAHPVVIDGRLYLREKDVVWCYDVKGK